MTTDEDSNLSAARAFVAFGLSEQRAGRRESASGPGSSLAAAKPALNLLRRTLRHRHLASVLDLGCGDWNWMQALALPGVGRDLQVRYEGWEASPELVNELNVRHGRPGMIEFMARDITTAPLPKVDLIIARDVLFHLSVAQALPLVDRIRESCRYFLSTSFLGLKENGDISSYLPINGWGFHKINLNVAPFNLAESMEEAVREPMCAHSETSRYMCLYQFRSIEA
jgi:SAM-dependent methyltransferase